MTFKELMKEQLGYECITTFWDDFSIADAWGDYAIRDTFKDCKQWLKDYKYWTELVLVLNWKLWYHYDRHNDELAKTYDDLWRQAENMFYKKYSKDKIATAWYYKITD